jgi:hypothetical protein
MKISRCSVCLLTGSELIPPRPCFCIGHCTCGSLMGAIRRYTIPRSWAHFSPLAGGDGRRARRRRGARARSARTDAQFRNIRNGLILNRRTKTSTIRETSARGAHTHIATCNKAERCVANSAEHRSTTRPPTVVRLCDHSTRNHDKETANSSPLYGRMGLSCARGMSPPRSLTHAPRSPAHRPRRPTAACRRPLSRTT